MFERFTNRARRALTIAQEEARLLGHGFIGTEHLLLGVIHEGEGVAAKALESLDISLDAVREKVEEIIGVGGASPSGSPPFTPRAKKVLELSLREALALGHEHIGTEHILLGIVREGEGVAAQVLVALGADPSRVRQRVVQLMAGTPGEPKRRGADAMRSTPRRLRGRRNVPLAVPEEWEVARESCALCGRDLWEIARYVEAGEGRVCEECIAAAADALASEPEDSRAIVLAPRVFGEPAEPGSVDQIVGAVRAAVGSREERGGREEAVEGAAELERHLHALDELLTGRSRVSRIRFLTTDAADVRFHFRVAGDDAEISAQGRVARVDGRWMLARSALVEVLVRAGVPLRSAYE